MLSLQSVSAEDLAKLFHHYQEALSHDFPGQAKVQHAQTWDEAPSSERNLLIAAARLALLELCSKADDDHSDRQYFAKPGEAEWGC
jgi:hypothetical protein